MIDFADKNATMELKW